MSLPVDRSEFKRASHDEVERRVRELMSGTKPRLALDAYHSKHAEEPLQYCMLPAMGAQPLWCPLYAA